MATPNTVNKFSFATGVVMPGIENRRDWDRNDAAIAKGINGTILPSGGFRKRPGMRFINECLHYDKPVTQVTFKFSQGQIYLLEFGDYRMRVYYDRAPVVNDDETPYEIETPYSAEQIAEADWAQEKDTIVFAHWDKPVKRLTRYGHTNWKWSDLFRTDGEGEERLPSPDAVEWYDNASDGHNGYEYAVTAYKIEDGSPKESISYSTLISDPATTDVIPESPQDNILSCSAWNNKYKEKYGGEEGFPAFPAEMDFTDILEDSQPPYHWIGSLNAKIHAVFAKVYGNLYSAERYWWTQQRPPYGHYLGWYLLDSRLDPSSDGRIAVFDYMYANEHWSTYTVLSPYESQVAGEHNTWFMRDKALAWLNADSVAFNGHTKTSIYNATTQFVEDHNDRYSQKIINHIKWTPVEGADGYFVYRRPLESDDRNFYNVATVTDATDWLDENVTETPIGEQTPITGQNTFTDPDNYPSLVTFYQQRLVLGATKSKPTTIFGSRTGIYTDFTINPSDISSGYEFKMASNDSDPLVAIIPLETLVVLTSGGDFISTVSGAMNASNVNFNQKSYNGSSGVRPIIVNDSGLYVPVGRQAIHTMTYAYEKNGFKHDNMLFHAQHLTRRRKVIGMAHQRDPINLVWAALDDGALLSCLFIPEQGFVAWTEHVTDGKVKSVNIVPRDGFDELWLVVQRMLGDGTVKQYLEVMEDTRPFGNVPEGEHAFFVDSGLSGVFEEEKSRITGLNHLEGREVAILADGSCMVPRLVYDGQITLDFPAKVVHVGLPYSMKMQTLRLELVNQGTLRDTRSQATQCIVEVEDCRELFVSSCGSEPTELIVHTADEFGIPQLINGDLEPFTPYAESARKAYMTFTSHNPVPCTINSIVVEIERGDG